MRKHTVRAAAAAAAALVGLGITSPQASANTTGARWNRLTVNYYDATGYSAVRSAVGDWSWWRTHAKLRVVRTTNPRAAQVRIYWKQLPAPTAAYASVATAGRSLVSCTIYLDVDLRRNYRLLRAVTAHEVGHCLGLAHTARGASVMNPTAKAWRYRPTWYDNRDMLRLYGHR